MSTVISRHVASPKMGRINRLSWLMGLYAENYQRLVRTFTPEILTCGTYVSSIGDQLDVHLTIQECHPYTIELCLTYAIDDPVTGQPDPSAHLRLYRDTRQVEATHCYIGRRWQDTIGLCPPPSIVLDHRLRMNTFLGKWLQYLAERGHGAATLKAAPEGCGLRS